MEKEHVYKIGDGYCGRTQTVVLSYKICNNCCVKNQITITTDSSDGEYNIISLCETCITKYINDFKNSNENICMYSYCKTCNVKFERDSILEFCSDNCNEIFCG